MKIIALILLIELATIPAALASVPGVDLPQLDFPQPSDPVTRDCGIPGTLTGDCLSKAG